MNMNLSPNHQKAVILYVDDDIENLESFKAAFRREYDILLANSAKDAIKILEAENIQVLITDQRMPEMSGSDFLKSVADSYPDMLRFMLTGFSDFSPLMDAINKGKLQGCFSKPLNILRLKEHIENGLSSYYLKRRNESLNKALQKNEALLRSIFSQAPLGIALLDVNGRFKMVNPKMSHIFGLMEEDLKKMSFNELIHHTNFETEFPLFQKILKEPAPIFGLNCRCSCLNQPEFWCTITLSKVEAPDGKIESVIAIVEDMTEKKQSEKEKRQLIRQLQQNKRLEAIGTLSSGIAHDFKNILSPIIGFAQLIIDSTENHMEINDHSRQILIAALRASDLVNQVLTFSREKGEEKNPIKIQPIIREALKLLRASIPSTISIRQKIIDEGGFVMANATQIYQIVINLLTNSFQAMADSGGVIDIEAGEVSLPEHPVAPFIRLSKGSYMKISIIDSGGGIEPFIMEHIFEPYFSTKKNKNGSGLGLSIVHGIVKGHGGEIIVDNQYGKGTAFHVYLPSIENGESDEAQSEEPLIPSGNESILLVDDEIAVAEAIRQMLTHLGYRVKSFSDSRKALEHYMEQPDAFDLVLSDITMPHMTGMELAKAILVKTPYKPIILCTGFTHHFQAENARKLGIKTIIMKPLVKKKVATIIREILNHSSQRRTAGL